MNLFELFVKIGVDDQASKKVSDLSSRLGNGLKTAATIGASAVSAAAAGITSLTTAAVNNYAEYEQLVGGVETLFKGSADKVQEYAANAYKTAGMSANEYMSTVTSFSASLLQSLGGDTDKAAEYANQALTDMSDNANKIGTSMEMIQNAYQGFAKQNYTMLDNLKLGYGGTKEEMARLIEDAAKLSDTVDAQDMSFGNIVKAINVVQTEMGITGTTAKEAARTIQGSVSMMKSAWANLVTGIADENADLERLIEDFVESTGVAVGNILPKVHKALTGAAKLVETLIPVIMEEIPVLIGETLPQILRAGVGVIETILQGISSQPDEIVETIFKVIDILIDAIIDLLPEIVATGILLIGKLAVGLVKAIPDLVAKIPEIIKSVVNSFKSRSGEFSGIGRDIVNGIWSGIKSMISTFTANVKNFFSGIVNSVKQTLGIRSPSRVFAEIGGFMAEGVSQGWDNQFDNVKKDINKSLYFDDASIKIGASLQKIGNGLADSTYGGFSIGNININIEGAKFDDPRNLAIVIAEEIQRIAESGAAVYA